MCCMGAQPVHQLCGWSNDNRVELWLCKCWLKKFASRSVTQEGEQEEDKQLFKINKLKSLGKQTSICSVGEGGMEGKSLCVFLTFF